MPGHRTRTARSGRSILPAAGLLAAALALVLALPGAATAGQRTDQAPEPGEAWMGAGVQMHEGDPTGGSPLKPLAATVEGVDVASHQGDVDWAKLANSGVRWAYSKSTEGTYYKNPYFTQQYNGSYDAGMIRGAYHFAVPSDSGGAAQADHFVDNGGGWSKDGKTLPGVLDIEYNPYGNACYGLSQSAMTGWISDFTARYKARTGRDAVIYTTTGWWSQCTGDNAGFGGSNPLWIARYGDSPGALPAGWGTHTFWQYTSTGPTVGDHNVFNGAYDRLKALADG